MNSQYLEVLKQSIEFDIEPPDIDTVLDSEYYLKGFFPLIYPFWRKKLRELFPNNITTKSTYVLLTGSIGGGKSTISQVIVLYDLIKMACVHDFAGFNQMMLQNGASCKVMNVYKFKAQDFVNTLNDAVFGGKVPFFQRELERGNKFLTNLRIEAAGPREDQLVSADVPIFWLSEMNKLKPEKALALINSADSRLSGRFPNSEDIFTHLIIDSSTTDAGDSTDIWRNTDPKADKAFIVQINAWNVREGLGTYFNYGSFEVYLGDSQRNPFIVPKDFPLSERIKLDQDRFLVCPNELREEAERDIFLFIQEKCGISISNSSKFFTNLKKLASAFTIPKEYDDILVLDFFDPSDTLMNKVRNDVAKLPTDRKLYIRLDCGISHDLYGVSVGYADGLDDTNVDGIPTDRMKIKIPIVFGISRFGGQETNIGKVEDFIIQLSENYDIGHVWCDQYQSISTKQILIQHGIECDIKSSDRTDSNYVTAKNYIYSGLVEIAENNLAYKEMSELERISPTKIDRIRDGISHKDASDCIIHLIGEMVNLGPEEVMASPETQINEMLIDTYDYMNEYRKASQARQYAKSYGNSSRYSDYL